MQEVGRQDVLKDYWNWLQVVTFWEGEIVDNKNYTFYTGKWEAT
jgi:hypothetical protein